MKVFDEIYNNNSWGSPESVSGHGFEKRNTVNLRKNLKYLQKTLDIKTILDVPCGDLNWITDSILDDVSYRGWDVVQELIEENKKKNLKPNFHIECKDVLVDRIPKVDLIICRDLLIHFPFKEIWEFLEKVVESNSKYLLVTCYTIDSNACDIELGQCRAVNLEVLPFKFHRALFYIKEEERGKFMVLYKISHLRSYIKAYKANLIR